MVNIEQNKQANQPNQQSVKLQSVSKEVDALTMFAERYRFQNNGETSIDACIDYLKETFFKNESVGITDYHIHQVVTVSNETGLNPFNNELYGTFTNFGNLKVLATIDGWMKLASNSDLVSREFIYSESVESVELGGFTYQVPTWIECKMRSESKGTAHSREYFWEIYNNSANQTVSWSRPARMLSNVAFIQCLRKLLRVSGISDSDAIADINKSYEAASNKIAAKQQCSTTPEDQDKPTSISTSANVRPKVRELNIDLDSVKIVDVDTEENSGCNLDAQNQEVNETETSTDVEAESAALEVESEPLSPSVQNEVAGNSERRVEEKIDVIATTKPVLDLDILENQIPRGILTIAKPMFEKYQHGQISVETLKQIRMVINSPEGLEWFDRKFEALGK